MPWQTIFYLIVVLFSVVVNGVLAAFAWRKRPAPGATPFVWLMLAAAAWAIMITFEFVTKTPEATRVWHQSKYFFIVLVPVIWFIFAMQYSGQRSWPVPSWIRLLVVIPLITLVMVWTNGLHGFIYGGISFTTTPPVILIAGEYGAWFWVHAIYSYLLMLAGTMLLISMVVRSRHLFRLQSGSVLLGAITPLLGNAISTAGLSYRFDLTPLAFVVSGLAFAWSLFRFRLLDLLPIARDLLVENMGDGMIVLNDKKHVVDINPAAQMIFNQQGSDLVGQPAEHVLAPWSEFSHSIYSEAVSQAEVCLRRNGDQQHYDVRVSPFTNRQRQLTGQMVLLHDITQRKQSELEIKRLNEALETKVAKRTEQLYLQNLELQRQVEERERAENELQHAYMSTLEGWGRALALRDFETEDHSRRVTLLTLNLAKRLGIDGDDLLHIQRGALLHDIGKMAIPDSILLKPGPLTEGEWDVMHQHPVHAYEMLSAIDFLQPALHIPYSHHEKWDGTGYPQGMRGKQIPLSARIFAVVDVWDALTSDRPYRLAWSREETLVYIQDQSGAHFDPLIVTIFLEMIEDLQFGDALPLELRQS